MEARFGNIVFTSKFDSGNLARAEKAEKDEADQEKGAYYAGLDSRTDHEFNVWTKPDCAGTPYENGNRSWFYFGVRGGTPGRVIKINIMNLNRQGKLYSQGYAPLVRTVPNKPKWDRIRERPTYETVDGQFILSFTHRFVDSSKGATVYFAFSFPWSYTECQDQLSELDKQYKHCASLMPNTCKSVDTYYHHEVLCHSLDHLNVDLLTISDCQGMSTENEPRFDDKLFPNKNTPRCKSFKNKRVYMVTSRVHPGETPASFVFNGFLEFILRPKDPRAQTLRRNFVFKLIPILNPDGVQRGQYRTDSRGVNLNRMYLDPDFSLYPSIYGSKSLLVHHHLHNGVKLKKNEPDRAGGSTKNGGMSKDNGGNAHNGVGNASRPSTSMSPSLQVAPQCYTPRSRTYNVVYDNGASSTTVVDSARLIGDDVVTPALPYSPEPAYSPAQTPSLAHSPTPLENHLGTMCTNLGALQMNIGSPAAYPNSSLSPYQTSDPVPYPTTKHQQSDEGTNLEKLRCVSFSSSLERDTDSPYMGNEGSDADDMDCGHGDIDSNHAPHLRDPALKEVGSAESGIAFYVDLHGHASKRGCFIYGNYFENEDIQVENMLFPKLISVNSAHFDFTGCNFTERNMYMKDKREGLSKEGSGRVAIHKSIGITHSYTLECNYNTGRMVNCVPPAYGDDGRATPPPLAGFPPKYTQQHFEDVGRAMAVAGLDMIEMNPWSRLVLCEHNSLHGVRDWVRRYIRGLRGLPRGVTNRTNRAAIKASSALGASTSGMGSSNGVLVPRVAFLTTRHNSNTGQDGNVGANHSTLKAAGNRRQQAGANTGARRELGPIRDVPRNNLERTQRRVSASSIPTTTPTTSTIATTSVASLTSTHPAPSLHPSPSLHPLQSAPVTLTLSTTTSGRPEMNPMVHLDAAQHAKLLENSAKLSTVFRNETLGKVTPSMYGSRPAVTLRQPQAVSIPSRMPKNPSFSRLMMRQQQHEAARSLSQREPSNDELMQSMEEEKFHQLKNIPNFPIRQKPPGHLATAKPLETPKSDPPKRRVRRVSPVKRRSSSHSPKSAKGARRNGGSSTDSDAEKRGKMRRRKSVRKNLGKRFRNEDITKDPADKDASLSPTHGALTTGPAHISPSNLTVVTSPAESCVSVTKLPTPPASHVRSGLPASGPAGLSKSDQFVASAFTRVDIASDILDLTSGDLLKTYPLIRPSVLPDEGRPLFSSPRPLPEGTTAPSPSNAVASPTPWI